MKYLILIFTLFTAINFASANEISRTGIIEAIEEKRIVFEHMPINIVAGPGLLIADHTVTDMANIDFSCETEVCKLIDNFKIGDEVLTKFNVVDGKYRLLNIRLCTQNDAECQLIVEEVESERKKLHDRVRKTFADIEIQNQCFARMDEELANDDRFAKENWFSRPFVYDQIIDKYNQMSNDTEHSDCIAEKSKNQLNVYIEICEKHGCADDTVGDCLSFGVSRDLLATRLHAIEQCR